MSEPIETLLAELQALASRWREDTCHKQEWVELLGTTVKLPELFDCGDRDCEQVRVCADMLDSLVLSWVRR